MSEPLPDDNGDASLLPPRARTLIELAQVNGYDVQFTWAIGMAPATRVTPSHEVTSVAVRMQRPGARYAAVWIDGKFGFAGTPTRKLTLTQLSTEIRKPPCDRITD